MKNLYKIVSISCLLIITNLFCQWEFIGLGSRKVEKLELKDNYIFASTDIGIYKKLISSTDTLWTSLGLQDKRCKALAIINLDTIFASISITSMDSDTLSLFLTTDGGRTWNPHQNNFGGGTGYSNQVLALSTLQSEKNSFLATGSLVIAKSDDFGETWNPVWSDWNYSGMGTHFIELDSLSDNIIWSGGESGFFQPYILKSIDNGNTWQENYFYEVGDNACYCAAVNPMNSNIVYIGMEGRIIKTTDGGENWETIYVPDNYPYVFGIEISSNNPSIIYASGLFNSDDPEYLKLYLSNNSGDTWDLVTDGVLGNKKVKDLKLLSIGKIDKLFFATNGSGVFTYENEVVAIGEDRNSQTPNNYMLSQNYPNPFNPTTEIKFSLQKVSNINLSVFNSKCELVQTLFVGKKGKGIHTINFDASGLNSGIYFYKMTTENHTITRKMLFLK